MLLRIWIALSLGMLLGAPPAPAQACPNPALLVGGYAQPQAAVRYLGDDALQARRAETPGERCAASYVAAEFRRLRLAPLGDDGGYYQQVAVSALRSQSEPSALGQNVIGLLHGASPALRDEVIVIGARYDRLSLGPGSLAPEAHAQVDNGAAYHASGVAAMLVAAERLGRDPPARSVVFVAFAGEEFHLRGSTHYTAQAPIPLEHTRAMLDLEMVGRLEADPLIVSGVGTAREWESILQRANNVGLPLALRPEAYGASDHTSFYLRDVPVLHFSTAHDDYPRVSDEWHRVDFEGVTRIARLVERVARDVGNRKVPLALVRNASPATAAEGSARDPGAYLGSIPDSSPADRGLRISGVREGSPAEYAGLRAGDLIVSFDDQRIADLHGLTEALRTRHPGERVRLSIVRRDARLILYADLGEPPSAEN